MRAAALVVLTLAAVPGGAPSAPAADPPLTPPPSYYRPVVVDGKTFPVARSNWLSVIEFDDSWHDPRFRLVDGKWRLVGFHEGVDIVAEEGTPVLTMTSGTVEAVGWTFYSGTRVGVRGRDGGYYLYAHLAEVAGGIRVGARVSVGDVLGLVGNTGYGPPGHEDEFPPHLHLGIERAGGWENPYPAVAELYRSSAEETAGTERRLSLLGRAGDRAGFDQLASELYADLPPE